MGAHEVGTPPLAGETTFDACYREHRDRLIATVNAATRCGADQATDAVDEAFVRALARWSRVERMDAPVGWIFTVARNVVTKTRGRRSIESDRIQQAHGVGVGMGDAPTPGVGPEAQWELWDAVAQLAERERTAVALRYLGDFTESQVAEIMGVAPGTVASTLSSARKHLAATLSATRDAGDGDDTSSSPVAAPTVTAPNDPKGGTR
jgi:RNA polymerase sigma factor (sigma-70 family)